MFNSLPSISRGTTLEKQNGIAHLAAYLQLRWGRVLSPRDEETRGAARRGASYESEFPRIEFDDPAVTIVRGP